MSETGQTPEPDLIDLISDLEDEVINCERKSGPYFRAAQSDRDHARGLIVERFRRLQQANAALVEREDKSQAALRTALEEIDWWASEHGCCLGHEKHAVFIIKSALASQ